MTKLDVSERLARCALGQHRSTQRKAPKRRAADVALTAEIVALAIEYGADVRQHRSARTVSTAEARGGRGERARSLKRRMLPKIHLKTDFDGHPIALEITGGEKTHAPIFETLLHLGPDAAPRAVVADKGYDSRANRAAARACGAIPVIPQKTNTATPAKHFARALCRGRARIEQAEGKLERFKRIALRSEKTRVNFASCTALTIGFILVQFIHTG